MNGKYYAEIAKKVYFVGLSKERQYIASHRGLFFEGKTLGDVVNKIVKYEKERCLVQIQ